MDSSDMDEGTGAVAGLLAVEVGTPASLVVQLAAARRPGVKLSDRLRVMNNEVPLTAQEIAGSDGDCQHWIRAQRGLLAVAYEVETLLSSPGVCRDFTAPGRRLVPGRRGARPGSGRLRVWPVADGFPLRGGDWHRRGVASVGCHQAGSEAHAGTHRHRRDAADIAFLTLISGRAELSGLDVTAVAAGDLPFDDHKQLAMLA